MLSSDGEVPLLASMLNHWDVLRVYSRLWDKSIVNMMDQLCKGSATFIAE